jgi:hypothetical protein
MVEANGSRPGRHPHDFYEAVTCGGTRGRDTPGGPQAGRPGGR